MRSITSSVIFRSCGRSSDCRAKPTASVHLYTSESEYTGPVCGAELLPSSRRKLFMRPLASSRSCIEGILFVTFTSRRFLQKPSLMLTARIGTCRSFACGDLARFSMPWFFQSGDCNGASVPDCRESAVFSGNALAPDREEAAATEMADARNCLRETASAMEFLQLHSLHRAERMEDGTDYTGGLVRKIAVLS